MNPPVYGPLLQWGTKMVRLSKKFKDYNFRTYFTNHVKDDLQKLQKLPENEQRLFLHTEGKERLLTMRRMVVVNRLFVSQRHIADLKRR